MPAEASVAEISAKAQNHSRFFRTETFHNNTPPSLKLRRTSLATESHTISEGTSPEWSKASIKIMSNVRRDSRKNSTAPTDTNFVKKGGLKNFFATAEAADSRSTTVILVEGRSLSSELITEQPAPPSIRMFCGRMDKIADLIWRAYENSGKVAPSTKATPD